jgi:hypothetical protein
MVGNPIFAGTLRIKRTHWRCVNLTFNVQKKDKCVSHPTSAAFRTAFSTPPAADTCAPTFHWLETCTGKSSVKGPSSIFFRFFCAGVLAAKKVNDSCLVPSVEMKLVRVAQVPCSDSAIDGACQRFKGLREGVR